MKGLDVCTKDGGKSKKGAAHYNYKDGSRSKYMPKFLAGAFEEAIGDPELLNLSGSIATQEAIIRDAIESLQEGEAPTRLNGKIRSEWQALWKATGREDGAAVAKHRETIGVLLGQAATVAATIDRIQVAEDTKRKLVETEMKRREKMREQIIIEDAVLLYTQLINANRKAILEFDVLTTEDARRLLNTIVSQFATIAGRSDHQHVIADRD